MMKIANAVDVIGEKAYRAYYTIERAVVLNYYKIENGAVNGFTNIRDKCVMALFAKNGETAGEAKARLKELKNRKR